MDMQVEKPWLAHYPPSVPASIDTRAYASLTDLLDEFFRKYAGRTACVCRESEFSFAEIDEPSASLAAWLQSKEMVRGSRVTLMMPNLPQYMAPIAAVLRAGYVVVNVNPLYTPRELEHQLKESGALAIVLRENFATTLEEVIDRTGIKQSCLPRGAICSDSGRAAWSTLPCAT